jgi:hypothetical protein
MVTGKLSSAGIVGIRREASEALSELADRFFSNPIYQRGVTFLIFKKALTDVLIFEYGDKVGKAVDGNDVENIKARIAVWFDGQKGNHEFYIPCFIAPYYASTFSIGPIEFTYIQEFANFANSQPQGVFEVAYSPFLQEMARRSANWIAKVSVQDCTQERAQEIGSLAVDLAIGSLQLFLIEDECRHMARLTGRTMPVFSHTLSRKNGNLSTASVNSEPGRLFGPGYLDQRLLEAKAIVDSTGKRVSAYLEGSQILPSLEQAWADATYWFHEGLAEPLDTIAVPKLETAIEVLLRSESTRGSKQRVVKAIQVFYGKKADEFINPHSQTTVKQFAKRFVEDRSRILHGTWSTLNHSLRGSRSSLTMVARDFLIYYSVFLDKYLVSQMPSDDIENFLNFIEGSQQSSTSAGL